MMCKRMVVFLGLTCCFGSISAATEPGVKPVGVYPFRLPGLLAKSDGKPKALLWCQGANLIGVVVPDEKSHDCNTSSQKRPAPSALWIRDGRCESDNGPLSFGFLVPRKAWVFEVSGRAPVERTVWLLHRFEGSLRAGQLKGELVQVDISHPGHPFQKSSVEAERLSEEQALFADEAAWRSGIGGTFCLATGEP